MSKYTMGPLGAFRRKPERTEHIRKIKRKETALVQWLRETELNCTKDNMLFWSYGSSGGGGEIVDELNKLQIVVSPYDKPAEGLYGFTLTSNREVGRAGRSPLSNTIHRRLHHPAKEILHDNVADETFDDAVKDGIGYHVCQSFEKAWNLANKCDHLVVRVDDPKKIWVGFVVWKREPEWHTIRRDTLDLIYRTDCDKDILANNKENFPAPATDEDKQADAHVGKIFDNGLGQAGFLEHNIPGAEFSMVEAVGKKFDECRYHIKWKNLKAGRLVGDQTMDAQTILENLEKGVWKITQGDEKVDSGIGYNRDIKWTE